MTTREKKNWYFGSLQEWAARCGSLTDRWLRLRTWEHLRHENAEDAICKDSWTHTWRSRGDTWRGRSCLHFICLSISQGAWLTFPPGLWFCETSPASLSTPPLDLVPYLSFFLFCNQCLNQSQLSLSDTWTWNLWGSRGPFAQSLHLMTLFILLRRAAATSSPSRLESTLGRWGLDSNFLFC